MIGTIPPEAALRASGGLHPGYGAERHTDEAVLQSLFTTMEPWVTHVSKDREHSTTTNNLNTTELPASSTNAGGILGSYTRFLRPKKTLWDLVRPYKNVIDDYQNKLQQEQNSTEGITPDEQKKRWKQFLETMQQELDFVKNTGQVAQHFASNVALTMDEDRLQVAPLCYQYVAVRTLLVLEYIWKMSVSFETKDAVVAPDAEATRPSVRTRMWYMLLDAANMMVQTVSGSSNKPDQSIESRVRESVEQEASLEDATRNIDFEAQLVQQTLSALRDNTVRDLRSPSAKVCDTIVRACRIGIVQCVMYQQGPPTLFSLRNPVFGNNLRVSIERNPNVVFMFFRIMMWQAESLASYCRMPSSALSEFFGDAHCPLKPLDLVGRAMAVRMHAGVRDASVDTLHANVTEHQTNTEVLHAVEQFLDTHHYNERTYIHEHTRRTPLLGRMEHGPFDAH